MNNQSLTWGHAIYPYIFDPGRNFDPGRKRVAVTIWMKWSLIERTTGCLLWGPDEDQPFEHAEQLSLAIPE